jgi:uncharacterized membrane protein YbhN (UPF0104 family)
MRPSRQETVPNRRPSRLSRWLRILGVVTILVLVWRWAERSGFDWAQFRRTFAESDPLILLLAVVLSAATYLIRATRWQVMSRPARPDAPLGPIFRDTVIGFAGAVLLGRAGEFVRPLAISRSLRVPFSSQVAVWFLERLMDLVAVLLFFGAALSHVGARGAAAAAGPEIQWVLKSGAKFAGLLGLASLITLLVFRGISPRTAAHLGEKLAWLPPGIARRLQGLLDSFAVGMEATRDLGSLAALFAYTALEWCLIAACGLAVLRAFPATQALGAWDSLVLLGFASFGSILQIPGVGGGMQVVSILVLTQLYRVPVEAATAIATVMWVVMLGLVVPPGVLLAIQSGLGWRDLRSQTVPNALTSDKP